MSELRRGLSVVALAAGLAVGAGCGGSSESGTAMSSATPSALTAPASSTNQVGTLAPEIVRTGTDSVTVDPSSAGAATSATGQATIDVPDASSHAADKEKTRVPAAFTVGGGKLMPGVITVPPALPVQLVVASADGQAHTLRFATHPAVTVRAGPNTPGSAELPGQPGGTYAVTIDGGAPQPALHVADDVGP